MSNNKRYTSAQMDNKMPLACYVVKPSAPAKKLNKMALLVTILTAVCAATFFVIAGIIIICYIGSSKHESRTTYNGFVIKKI